MIKVTEAINFSTDNDREMIFLFFVFQKVITKIITNNNKNNSNF